MSVYDLKTLQELDKSDPLRAYRDEFELAEGLIYLDGNSLGPLPKKAKKRVQDAVEIEWGQDLITSWNKHGWMHKPQKLGDMIANIVGADAGSVKVGDSTSVNVFKVLAAAIQLAPSGRTKILSDTANFPTDLYMAQGLQELLGRDNCELVIVDETEVEDHIDDQTAIIMLTHVNFRSGRMYDMKKMTQLAHEKGALMMWDLAHSAGAVPVNLKEANTDFAVGCGYKYLNGGPGAPAFVYV
ncbi:MAG: aminotransferase class V-fold PLP-dependent enzyme, partial [Alphaproteobacteria bacterium]|nr:aminotransferase class V-fold PLP-dependent enzyme [Alphaproteobacteria bacterium]